MGRRADRENHRQEESGGISSSAPFTDTVCVLTRYRTLHCFSYILTSAAFLGAKALAPSPNPLPPSSPARDANCLFSQTSTSARSNTLSRTRKDYLFAAQFAQIALATTPRPAFEDLRVSLWKDPTSAFSRRMS